MHNCVERLGLMRLGRDNILVFLQVPGSIMAGGLPRCAVPEADG